MSFAVSRTSLKTHFSFFFACLASFFSLAVLAAASQAATQDDPAIKDGKAVKVACVGDSITNGFHVSEGMAWPDQMSKMLGGTCDVRHFGLVGLHLVSYQTTEEFQKSKTFNPDVLVIMLGFERMKVGRMLYKRKMVLTK